MLFEKYNTSHITLLVEGNKIIVILVVTHIHTHIYNGMLLNHKKELNFTICNNMDKPGGYYAK